MHLAIDGETTPEQQAQLDRILESPVSRAEYDALRNLARELDTVPLLEPPGLRQSILERLRPAPVVPLRSRRRMALALAYAAAAVIVLGVIVHRMPPSSETAATMISPESGEWPVIARARSADALMTVRRNGDQLAIDISIPSDGGCVVEWDGQKLLPSTGRATFQKPPVTLQLRRRPGASGPAVIALHFPDKPGVQTRIDLRGRPVNFSNWTLYSVSKEDSS